jgi:DNA-binding NtrC family response regulator
VARLLLIDDEASLRRVLATLLGADGHEVVEAGHLAAAREALASAPFDAVLTDQQLPDGEGLRIVEACRALSPPPPVIVITAFATVELAVEAMRLGAFDFITKPFLPEAVRAAVRRAAERSRLERENARLRDEVRRLSPDARLLGRSAPVRALLELVTRVAAAPVPVLVRGETGTGKELVARALHALGPRAGGPFVAVNCGAIPEALLESELFGHEKGAFTGAVGAREGVFEAADGGTLLLDEIGDMPLAAQARLLRVLAEGQVTRIGSTRPRRVDVRVVAATHRDLRAAVQEGRFREDLWYRLAVAILDVPPLRERGDDVALLATHFLARAAERVGRPHLAFTADALERLAGHTWPGNVRELENLAERCALMSLGEVDARAVGAALGGAPPGPAGSAGDDTAAARAAWLARLPAPVDLRHVVEGVERELLERALRESGGVQAEAGRRLGLSRSDVAYRLRKFGFGPPEDPA